MNTTRVIEAVEPSVEHTRHLEAPIRGRQIRQWREQQLGLSRREFARALGITPRTVIAWELDEKRPPHPLLLQAALNELAARRRRGEPLDAPAPFAPGELARLRRRLWLTQRELAHILGLNSNTLAQWERGTYSLRTTGGQLRLALDALAAALADRHLAPGPVADRHLAPGPVAAA